MCTIHNLEVISSIYITSFKNKRNPRIIKLKNENLKTKRITEF